MRRSTIALNRTTDLACRGAALNESLIRSFTKITQSPKGYEEKLETSDSFFCVKIFQINREKKSKLLYLHTSWQTDSSSQYEHAEPSKRTLPMVRG